MARQRSFDGRYEDMPGALRRAHEVDRSYYKDALCRQVGHVAAWIVEPRGKYMLGGQKISGDKLLQAAHMICRQCPVQWECAAVAIEADERAGVWSDWIDNIRWLSLRKDWKNRLQMAKSTGTSVQMLITIMRRDMT
jgi:hypothetical protein